MLNPDGVFHGHYRTDMFGVNLNRVYKDPDPLSHSSIFASKSLILFYHLYYATGTDVEPLLNGMSFQEVFASATPPLPPREPAAAAAVAAIPDADGGDVAATTDSSVKPQAPPVEGGEDPGMSSMIDEMMKIDVKVRVLTLIFTANVRESALIISLHSTAEKFI